jgi:hypothetical protein
MAAPDDRAFSTGRLRRGDRVTVLSRVESEWLAIKPPDRSFSWIDRDAIEELGGGRARVIVDQAAVRFGRPNTRMPGSASCALSARATVLLVDRPALTLRQGSRVRTWVAIMPPDGETRYVRAKGIKLSARPQEAQDQPEPRPSDEADAGSAARRPDHKTIRVSERLGPIDPSVASVGPDVRLAALPPGLAARTAPVERLHRAILQQPFDRWQLEPIRQRYRSLLDQETDPAARSLLQTRLDHVARQEALAESARSFETLLAQSRERDREVAHLQQRGVDARTMAREPYDAEGLLQQSSRQVDGQRVFALIGGKGETSAYLLIPPGLDAESCCTRRVGVRGTVRFHDKLRTNLISVRELDALSDPP